MPRRPDFIIIGAMKCATSTLHDQLAAQPGFFMSDPKEPNFFSDAQNWSRGLGWYEGLFARASPQALCGESSTHYTKLPRHRGVVARLVEHVPAAKFVYVMRHPLDRLVSHYVHEWSQRVLSGTLAEAIETHPPLVQFGQYAMQLEPYLAAFGRERVLPVFFDRLRAHPQHELERVCAFLGYGGPAKWRDDVGAKNVSGERMRTSKLRDLIVHAPVLSTIRRRLVPQAVRNRIKTLWQMQRRPELTVAQRQQLAAKFDPDLAKLGAWLGIDDLSCATFVARTRDRAHNWAPS